MGEPTLVVPDAADRDLPGVAVLPPGAERPADTIKALGVLWPDAHDGYLRVYFNPELDEYVRVAADDVVATRELDPPDAEFPRQLVYVRRAATIEHIRVTPMEKQTEFLSGDLFSGVAPHLKASGQSVLALTAFAGPDTIRAGDGTLILCTLIFDCTRGCPSDISICLCSFERCSQGRDCCRGTIQGGTCG